MDTTSRRSSAVLLLLLEKQGETYVVLTKRTNEVGNHKGQISMPGGAREPQDSSLLETALRETQEELGIERSQMMILDRLPDVYTSVSNFNITPFVARLITQPDYQPDPREVAQVIEVPLSAFRNPEEYWEEERIEPAGRRMVHFFRYRDHVIWGATARILKRYVTQLETEPTCEKTDEV